MALFENPEFKQQWLKALKDNPSASLDDFIKGLHDQPLSEDDREDAEILSAYMRHRLYQKQQKADKVKEYRQRSQRSGFHISYKLHKDEMSYLNSNNQRVTASSTTISLC